MAWAAVAVSWPGPGAMWRYTPTAAGESDATNPGLSRSREGTSYTSCNLTGARRSSERSWADCVHKPVRGPDRAARRAVAQGAQSPGHRLAPIVEELQARGTSLAE